MYRWVGGVHIIHFNGFDNYFIMHLRASYTQQLLTSVLR
jgi:hypothetical protein